MALKPSVIVATAVFAGALGVGGISLASAQESTTTTPDPTVDSTPDSTPEDDPNCPHGDTDASESGTSGATSESV